MPYTVIEENEQFCVYRVQDGKPFGDSLGCHASPADAQAQITAITISEAESPSATVQRTYGSPIKHKGNRTLEGYLVRFNEPGETDLHGEHFSTKTYFMLEAGYPIKGAPINYQHGDSDFGSFPLGVFDFANVDDVGLFVRGQLNDREAYMAMLRELGRVKGIALDDDTLAQKSALALQAVDELIANVPLQFSMGADLAAWEIDPQTGHIDTCGIVHGALTPTPADDQNPEVQFKFATIMKHLTLQTKSDSIEETLPPTAKVEPANQEPPPSSAPEMDGLKLLDSEGVTNRMFKQLTEEQQEILMKHMSAALDEMLEAAEIKQDELTEEERTDLEAEMVGKADDIMEEAEVKQDELTEELVEEMLEKRFADLIPEAIKAYMLEQEQAKQKKDRFEKAIEQHKRQTPATSEKSKVGGYGQGMGKIEVVDDLKYAHLTAEQMALGMKIAGAALFPHGQPRGLKATHFVDAGILSEQYVITMAHKITKALGQQPEFTPTAQFDSAMVHDRIHMKHAMPWKADELDAVAITNQGAEWAFIFYDTRLWERARHLTELFNRLVNKGMRTVDVTGKSMNVKLNTGSPTVYTAPEARSLDATGRPEVVVQTTPFTTDEVQKDVRKHMLATAFTDELDEDSIIDIQAFLDEDVVQTMAESTESVILNGDTTTTSSNINTDSTPATGIRTPNYIAWDGVRHTYLVDNTTQGNAKGAALVAEDYEDTIMLLDPTIVNRRDQMLFVVDSSTQSATRKLPEVLTDDVNTPKGTVFTGQIGTLFDVDLYMSGQLGLSQADGTISDTAANNTKGSVVCIYAPYWQYGRKREMTIELDREAQSSSTVVVASVRHILAARGADAASATYNLTV